MQFKNQTLAESSFKYLYYLFILTVSAKIHLKIDAKICFGTIF